MLRKGMVQVMNPKTERYVLINKATGTIVSHKSNKKPYKNVTVAKPPTIKRKNPEVFFEED